MQSGIWGIGNMDKGADWGQHPQNWVLCESCMAGCQGESERGQSFWQISQAPVCHTKDFDLETAIHGCPRELNEVIHITYSARNHNCNIT